MRRNSDESLPGLYPDQVRLMRWWPVAAMAGLNLANLVVAEETEGLLRAVALTVICWGLWWAGYTDGRRSTMRGVRDSVKNFLNHRAE